jgi:hypothetical protein
MGFRHLIRDSGLDIIPTAVQPWLIHACSLLATSLPTLAIRDEMPQFTVVSVHSVATVTAV